MPLAVYNTMTRKKEPFEPLEEGKVRMYVCGPTVYDSCHLGHARHGVVWDTIRRYLEYAGYDVTYVVNITDIDDKIIKRANEEGTDWRFITTRYIPDYFRDMDSLGVRRPDIQPRATEHIPEMIEAVKGLIDKGFAYEAGGSVYFEVAKFEGYGKLSKRPVDEEGSDAVARVDPDPNKRAPADFALWKASKPGEPAWETPWGKGRPGWHIECSVMSSKYLGAPFDIHGGGADLIFPHHENEIAQAEALTGKKFVKYWLHNGFITVREEKMSKSLGNFVTLKELIGRYTGSALRMFFLGAHYRSPIEYAEERLVEAARAADRIYNCLEAVDRYLGIDLREDDIPEQQEVLTRAKEIREEFAGHMDDDFNTAGALGCAFRLVDELNMRMTFEVGRATLAAGPWLGLAANILREFIGVLGLPPEREKLPEGKNESALVDLLVSVRGEARTAKQFAIADRVRSELARLGYEIEDAPGGESRVVRRVKK